MKGIDRHFPEVLFMERSFENPVRNRPATNPLPPPPPSGVTGTYNLKPCTMQESCRNSDIPALGYSAKRLRAVSRFAPNRTRLNQPRFVQ